MGASGSNQQPARRRGEAGCPSLRLGRHARPAEHIHAAPHLPPIDEGPRCAIVPGQGENFASGEIVDGRCVLSVEDVKTVVGGYEDHSLATHHHHPPLRLSIPLPREGARDHATGVRSISTLPYGSSRAI